MSIMGTGAGYNPFLPSLQPTEIPPSVAAERFKHRDLLSDDSVAVKAQSPPKPPSKCRQIIWLATITLATTAAVFATMAITSQIIVISAVSLVIGIAVLIIMKRVLFNKPKVVQEDTLKTVFRGNIDEERRQVFFKAFSEYERVFFSFFKESFSTEDLSTLKEENLFEDEDLIKIAQASNIHKSTSIEREIISDPKEAIKEIIGYLMRYQTQELEVRSSMNSALRPLPMEQLLRWKSGKTLAELMDTLNRMHSCKLKSLHEYKHYLDTAAGISSTGSKEIADQKKAIRESIKRAFIQIDENTGELKLTEEMAMPFSPLFQTVIIDLIKD